MRDPMSGAKQASAFITDLMDERAAESEVEKAEDEKDTDSPAGSGKRPDVSTFTPQAQELYQSCVAGMKTAGVEGDAAEKVCGLQAHEFDRRHPSGIDTPDSDSEEPEVEKTVSTAGMAADLGSPSAEVALTDTDQKRKKRLGLNR